MKLLIIGASSYVGAKLYTDLKENFDVSGTYNTNKLFDDLIQLDMTKEQDVSNVVHSSRPDVIVHVAANANAGWCEAHPEEAVKINQTSTEYVVNAANSINAKVIYISSYAVINHSSLYAKTKLASEQLIKRTNAGFIILRPAHIVGCSPNTKNDRQFNRFLKNLLEKTPAVYNTSWKFQPTYLHHLSEVIVKLLADSVTGQVIPIAVPETVSRFDLARDILTPFGVEVKGVDKNDTSPKFLEDLSLMKTLNLPEYSYDEMIKCILEEIKENFTSSLA